MMSRRLYFSFHYQDVIDFRANVVRLSWRFRHRSETFRDGSIWEEAQEKKVKRIKLLIDSELFGKSVNCVLIGEHTYSRRFVRYEIVKSFQLGKGQFGVGINWIKDKYGEVKIFPGENPFRYLMLQVSQNGKEISFLENKYNSWQVYRDLPSIRNSHFGKDYFGKQFLFSNLYRTYSYVWDGGKTEFSNWIEIAASDAGR